MEALGRVNTYIWQSVSSLETAAVFACRKVYNICLEGVGLLKHSFLHDLESQFLKKSQNISVVKSLPATLKQLDRKHSDTSLPAKLNTECEGSFHGIDAYPYLTEDTSAEGDTAPADDSLSSSIACRTFSDGEDDQKSLQSNAFRMSYHPSNSLSSSLHFPLAEASIFLCKMPEDSIIGDLMHHHPDPSKSVYIEGGPVALCEEPFSLIPQHAGFVSCLQQAAQSLKEYVAADTADRSAIAATLHGSLEALASSLGNDREHIQQSLQQCSIRELMDIHAQLETLKALNLDDNLRVRECLSALARLLPGAIQHVVGRAAGELSGTTLDLSQAEMDAMTQSNPAWDAMPRKADRGFCREYTTDLRRKLEFTVCTQSGEEFDSTDYAGREGLGLTARLEACDRALNQFQHCGEHVPLLLSDLISQAPYVLLTDALVKKLSQQYFGNQAVTVSYGNKEPEGCSVTVTEMEDGKLCVAGRVRYHQLAVSGDEPLYRVDNNNAITMETEIILNPETGQRTLSKFKVTFGASTPESVTD